MAMWLVEPLEAMKNRFPEKCEDWHGMVLWNCTAFPFNRPYKALRQAMRFEELAKQGLGVCFICDNPYKCNPVRIDDTCGSCKNMKRTK